MSIDLAKAAELRKPFPAESVGKLPKGGQMLDYVGHAAVTDRLLTVDPEWSWEPFAVDEHGLPAMQGRNLWIRLTVCGVTRIGVGDGMSAKECIGDAIRNAAMRFGVALDLWAKENLVEFAQAAAAGRNPVADSSPAPPAVDTEALFAAWHAAGSPGERISVYVSHVLGREIHAASDLTQDDVDRALVALEQRPAPEQAGEVSGEAAPGEADTAPAVDVSDAGSSDVASEAVASDLIHRAEEQGSPASETPDEPERAHRSNPRPISNPQKRMLMGLFNKFGLAGDGDERDERLRILSVLAVRDIRSSGDLSTGEASRIIDRLTKVEDVAELLAIANGGAA